MDRLACITEVVFSLDDFDNTDNLEDGNFSNVLLRHYVTGSEEFKHLEPVAPQYKQLRNGEPNSLTLRITDQKGKVITDGPGITIVLHIR